MEKKISSVMVKPVVTVDMEDTVEKIEHILNLYQLSTVPVIDSVRGDCFGIISASDIVHFLGANRNPKVVRAWEMCTYQPIEVSPDTTVREAARLMVLHKIHHLVITENKSIKGFVSSFDLIEKFMLMEVPVTHRVVPAQMRKFTAIGQRRHARQGG